MPPTTHNLTAGYVGQSIRRKEDAREVPNSIKIGLKGGLRLPPGLSTGEHISLLINRETLNYSMVPSFNDLPIPSRCVSTELISGKPYVFDKGSLSLAMRATMSIPGVFDPVREGDKVFVDGGLVDNLPTDVVRNMGADVGIAFVTTLIARRAQAHQGKKILGVTGECPCCRQPFADTG